MKHNWEYKQLGDICDKGSSNLMQKNLEIIDDGFEVFGASGCLGKIDFYQQEAPYVGIVKDGSGVGRCNLYPAKSSLLGTMQYILAKNCVTNEFLCYLIQSLNLSKYVNGAAIPHIYFRDYKKEIVPVPPLEEQTKIVAELNKINETIEDCRELLRNLDALSQSLFYDFFGDPITNPKGWPIDKLGNLLIIERGGSPRPIKEYITQDEDGINWIKIGDANSSMYISSTKEKIKPSGKSKSRFVKPGDFILSNSMSFGRPYIMNTYGCIHDGWLLLRDNNNFFNKIYLYYCLNSKSIYSEFERLVRTGTVSNLNSDIVRGVKIPVPPLAHQEKFAERIEQIEAQKKAVEQTIAELQTLLDSRMDYWFN